MRLAWWLQRLSWRDGEAGGHPPEGVRMTHGTDERDHSKGYNIARPAQRPRGGRPPLLEAFRPGQQVKGQRAATCANESIPSPHHRVRTTPPERSIRFPCLITSHDVLPQTSWTHPFWAGPPRLVLSVHSRVGPERCLVDLRPMSVALRWLDSTLTTWARRRPPRAPLRPRLDRYPRRVARRPGPRRRLARRQPARRGRGGKAARVGVAERPPSPAARPAVAGLE
jgi:hypothetical protein